MANKSSFDNELITIFLKSFKKRFNIFVDKVRKEDPCKTCEHFCNGCKGIESFSGQKNCLINRISNFNGDTNSTIGSQTISLWLSGKSNYLPNLSLLKKVALVMDCKLDDFFQEELVQHSDDYVYLKNKVVGHYGVYHFNQINGRFYFGILSIVKNSIDGTMKAYAMFKINNNDDMVDKVYKLNCGSIKISDVFKNNAYVGSVDIDKDAMFITFTPIQKTVRDKVVLVIPNTINFQDNFALQDNKVNYDGKLLGGYGIGTCLNNHIFREAFSFPFVFSKNPIEIDASEENIKKIYKDIKNDELPNGDFTNTLIRSFYNKTVCVTQEMEENLVEYLMDDVK